MMCSRRRKAFPGEKLVTGPMNRQNSKVLSPELMAIPVYKINGFPAYSTGKPEEMGEVM